MYAAISTFYVAVDIFILDFILKEYILIAILLIIPFFLLCRRLNDRNFSFIYFFYFGGEQLATLFYFQPCRRLEKNNYVDLFKEKTPPHCIVTKHKQGSEAGNPI